MQKSRVKLAYVISALWGLISIPISEVVYDDMLEDSGFLMRIFALLLVLMPIWMVFGWRWLTNNKAMPAKLWLMAIVVAVIFALSLATDRYLDDLAFIPIATLAAFLLLIWTFEGSNMLSWRKQPLRDILPSPTELKNGTEALLKLTEGLSNEILGELRRLSPDDLPPLKLPKTPIIDKLYRLSPDPKLHVPKHAMDSLLCAYALVYSNFRERGFKKGSKVIPIFATYKSITVTNFTSIMQPKIPGIEPLAGDELKLPEIRKPVENFFKMIEREVETVADNLSRNAANPYYPLYDSFRIYVSPEATARELNITFDAVFSKWNGQAKQGIAFLVHQ